MNVTKVTTMTGTDSAEYDKLITDLDNGLIAEYGGSYTKTPGATWTVTWTRDCPGCAQAGDFA